MIRGGTTFRTQSVRELEVPVVLEIVLDAEPRILFVSGPEKGFSPPEIELLRKMGQGVCLHRNILRAETAPLVALSRLQLQT